MATIKSIISGFLGLKKDPNATTQDVAVIKAEDTNAGIVLKPNGTGAIMAQVPDGTAAGGDARGNGAVDFQKVRTNSNQVAGGALAFIGNGNSNRITSISYGTIVNGFSNVVSQELAFIGCGESNTVSGIQGVVTGGKSNNNSSSYGVISGGQSNTASTNTHATVLGGQENTASGRSSVAGGNKSVASGLFGVAIGGGATASDASAVALGGYYGTGPISSGQYTLSYGGRSQSYLRGQISGTYEIFSAQSDAQWSCLNPIKSGTVTSGSTLNIDLSNNNLVLIAPLGNNRAWNVTCKWVAVVQNITGTATGVNVGDIIVQVQTLGFKKVGGISSVVGTTNTISTNSDTSMNTATMGYSANRSGGGGQELALTFTAPTYSGGGSLDIRIVVKLELTEVAW